MSNLNEFNIENVEVNRKGLVPGKYSSWEVFDNELVSNENLNKAMRNGFYYEAIFIEYAILEDRLAAVLKYAGLKYCDDKGRDFAITKKIGIIENRECFNNRFVRERLSLELLSDVRAWLKDRNNLIHHLATTPYDSEQVKEIASEGNELVRIVSNKSKSVINRFKRDNN